MPFTWQLNWKICVFSLCFFPLMVSLGFWQLDRADQKRTLQQTIERQQALDPIKVSSMLDLMELSHKKEAQDASRIYRKVELLGQFDQQHIWLLENKHMQGRLGYHVLQPFILNDGKGLLVDRGWLPSQGDRSHIPEISVPFNQAKVKGLLVNPTYNAFLANEKTANGWPRWVLQVNVEAMSEQSQIDLTPWVLQIEPSDLAAFTAYWENVSMPARKHLGYAVQWFAMAFALAILTLFANSNIYWVIRHTFDKQ